MTQLWRLLLYTLAVSLGSLISHRATDMVWFGVVKHCQLYTQFVTDQSRRQLTYGKGGEGRGGCVFGGRGRTTPA